ncbi:hypothetical protein GQ600_527 [Phytophthora cactorum]|nr:hypothetical protein GQ600_527 [Phytophthora cactorum]
MLPYLTRIEFRWFGIWFLIVSLMSSTNGTCSVNRKLKNGTASGDLKNVGWITPHRAAKCFLRGLHLVHVSFQSQQLVVELLGDSEKLIFVNRRALSLNQQRREVSDALAGFEATSLLLFIVARGHKLHSRRVEGVQLFAWQRAYLVVHLRLVRCGVRVDIRLGLFSVVFALLLGLTLALPGLRRCTLRCAIIFASADASPRLSPAIASATDVAMSSQIGPTKIKVKDRLRFYQIFRSDKVVYRTPSISAEEIHTNSPTQRSFGPREPE